MIKDLHKLNLKQFYIYRFFNTIKKNTNIILYGYGTIGKEIEKHILNYRKDITILTIVDNHNLNQKTLSTGINTISSSQLDEIDTSDSTVIICNDNKKIVSEIKNELDNKKIAYKPINFKKSNFQFKYKTYLYPIYQLLVIITTPFILLKTLWNCRVLANGKWSQYNRYSPYRAINSLFYWVQAVNIDKYGRDGVSPTIGLGNYHLGKWFQVTLPSLYLYWRTGAILPLTAMLLWLFSHFIWLNNDVDFSIIFLTTIILLFSSTFYASTFEMQNYNVLGWIFFPAGLYGLYTQNYYLAALAWFMVSFGSFTASFLGGLLSAFLSIATLNILPILSTLPMVLKITTHFIPMVKNPQMRSQLKDIAKGIGLTKKDTKYKRDISFSHRKLWYFLLLYFQFILTFYLIEDKFDILFVFMVVIFILNESRLLRFADGASIHVVILSLSAVIIINNPSVSLYLSALFLLNPLAVFLEFVGNKNFIIVPNREPFYIKPLIDKTYHFMSSISSNEKVLFCFFDPHKDYTKLFLGGRPLMELPFYVSAKRDIHTFPDFHAAFELNHENSQQIWIENYKDVLNLKQKWHADYVIVMTDTTCTKTNIEKVTQLSVVSSINWKEVSQNLNKDLPYKTSMSKWYLLK